MKSHLFLAVCLVVGSIGLILLELTLVQTIGLFMFVSAYYAGNSDMQSRATERALREVAHSTKDLITSIEDGRDNHD